MVQASAPDAWTETFLITIKSNISGSTAINFPATVTTYDITGGDKDFTEIANGIGGRIKKFEAQTPYEVSLEAYSLEAGTLSGATTGAGFADLLGTIDTTQPLSVVTDHNRQPYLLAIAHTTSLSATSAIAVSVAGDRIERDIFKNGHFVGYTSSMTDGIRKHTIKYKVTAFAKDGSSNIIQDSSDGSATAVVPAITYP
jgi:hypothetical protein